MLRQFRRSIRPDDRIYAADAAECFSLPRHRAWLLNVPPVPQTNGATLTASNCGISVRCGRLGILPATYT
jgi:hypothetical protein